MEERLNFILLLFNDFHRSMKKFIKFNNGDYFTPNYMNKNHGKTALKRKIVYLRQELLNLERMLDE